MLEASSWICSPDGALTCPEFVRRFSVTKKPRSAVLTITSSGVYEARINSERVGDFFMAPGWTDYKFCHQVQRYDVASMLRDKNELTVHPIILAPSACRNKACSLRAPKPSGRQIDSRFERAVVMPSRARTPLFCQRSRRILSAGSSIIDRQPSMLSRTPATTAEPITPATFGPIACMSRKFPGFSACPTF